MTPEAQPSLDGAARDATHVSGRFLSDLFRTLEREGLPARSLVGDLPVDVDERGEIDHAVDWDVFVDLMKRLEVAVDGPAGLEHCGELIGKLAPAGALRSLAGYAAAPGSLYRAATRWALRRAMPGIETRCTMVAPDRLEIRARIRDDLRPCPQIFHFATGGARALPKLIGSKEAVVSTEIAEREATYRITLPPSATLGARVLRFFRTVFSAGS